MSATVARFSRTLHWMTSALGLVTLAFFSVTGITLNHPDWFRASHAREAAQVNMAPEWMARFREAPEQTQLGLLTHETAARWGLDVPRNIDRDEYEWVLDYPRPGGLGTVILDLEAETLSYERIDDGLVALVNDLHKGRHTGLAWKVLIDVVSVVCLLFSLTGLVLLRVHAGKRASTWPLVGLGALIPLSIYWWFVP